MLWARTVLLGRALVRHLRQSCWSTANHSHIRGTPTEHGILQEKSNFDSAEAAAGFQIHFMIQMEKWNYFPFSYCLNLWQAMA